MFLMKDALSKLMSLREDNGTSTVKRGILEGIKRELIDGVLNAQPVSISHPVRVDTFAPTGGGTLPIGFTYRYFVVGVTSEGEEQYLPVLGNVTFPCYDGINQSVSIDYIADPGVLSVNVYRAEGTDGLHLGPAFLLMNLPVVDGKVTFIDDGSTPIGTQPSPPPEPDSNVIVYPDYTMPYLQTAIKEITLAIEAGKNSLCGSGFGVMEQGIIEPEYVHIDRAAAALTHASWEEFGPYEFNLFSE